MVLRRDMNTGMQRCQAQRRRNNNFAEKRCRAWDDVLRATSPLAHWSDDALPCALRGRSFLLEAFEASEPPSPVDPACTMHTGVHPRIGFMQPTDAARHPFCYVVVQTLVLSEAAFTGFALPYFGGYVPFPLG